MEIPLNSVMKDLNQRWKEEHKKFKQIKKDNKGLFLLYEKDLIKHRVIIPYYFINEFDNKFLYGSRAYHNKRELTKEEHIKYFKLLDKQKAINKKINKYIEGLK